MTNREKLEILETLANKEHGFTLSKESFGFILNFTKTEAIGFKKGNPFVIVFFDRSCSMVNRKEFSECAPGLNALIADIEKE